MSQSGSYQRTRRKSPTPIHQFPQGLKQRGVEGGPGRRGRRQQCSEVPKRERLGRRDHQGGDEVELTKPGSGPGGS